MFAFASLVVSAAEPEPSRVVERGPHHATWQRAERETGPKGKVFERQRTYQELASGLNYFKDGEWIPSIEEIEILEDGAIARQGQHQVFFPGNINTLGGIDLLTADGKRFRSQILGLAYTCAASGRSAMVAELKDSVGLLVAPNQVLYPDAFDADGFKADVRLTYTKGGFEQDIILREAPPSPSEYGLDPETTLMEVYTEFLQPPTPRKGVVIINRQTNPAPRANMAEPDFADEVLDFGAMRMGRGNAFPIETPVAEFGEEVAPVVKRWERREGKDLLIEKVQYSSIRPQLDTLPKAVVARAADRRALVKRTRDTMIAGLGSPPRRDKTETAAIQVAGLSRQRRGLVIDYTLVSASSNFTFYGDATYWVTGPVTLTGTTKFIGGAVVKSTNANGSTGRLSIQGPVDCHTSAYRPVVFTGKDDNTVGETISGSTGNPNTNYYGLYVNFSGNTNVVDLHDIRVRHAYWGVNVSGSALLNIRHAQFTRNWAAVVAGTAVNLRNVLVQDGVHTIGGSATGMQAEHLTTHRLTNLRSTSWVGSFTNCLFISTTNNVYYSGSNIYTNRDDSGIFETVGGGAHYLAAGSPHRNAGTTNINPDLLKDLAQRTTYSPVVFSNATITIPTTFSPQAQRDTDIPDLGYHYDSLDYAFGGTDANTNITFAAGTAVGWFRTANGYFHAGHGLHIADRQVATFDGRFDAPTYWVRCNVVQEGSTGLWDGGFGTGGITGWASQSGSVTNSPELRARFTRFSMMSYDGNHFRDDNGYLIARLTDCELWGGGVGAYVLSAYMTNCLMDRVGVYQIAGFPGNEFHLRNCTFSGGTLYFDRYYSTPAIPTSVYDCAFDATTIVNDSEGNTDFNYNAYTNGATYLSPSGTNNVLVSSFPWESIWDQRFYLPTNSALINSGSLTNAGLRGLYHYTSTTNQVKEANSALNIGYLYVAASAPSQAIDTDGDGIADYFEDSNGNGVYDAGTDLSDWNSYDSPNGLTGSPGLQIFTPLK